MKKVYRREDSSLPFKLESFRDFEPINMLLKAEDLPYKRHVFYSPELERLNKEQEMFTKKLILIDLLRGPYGEHKMVDGGIPLANVNTEVLVQNRKGTN